MTTLLTLYANPELAFAEWMASHVFNHGIQTEYMRYSDESTLTSHRPEFPEEQGKEAQSKVLQLKESLGKLQRIVENFALYQAAEMKREGQRIFSVAARDLRQHSLHLENHENSQIQSAVKDVKDFIHYLNIHLRSPSSVQPVQLQANCAPHHQYSLKDFEAQQKKILEQIAELTNPLCGPPLVRSPYFEEEKGLSFTTVDRHVAKLDQAKVIIYHQHPVISQFVESSAPTHYYLINNWLVVSTNPPSLGKEKPNPSEHFEFKSGDEVVVFQELMDEVHRPPPDEKVRQGIIAAIHIWNEFQAKKMWAVMVTTLAGAVIFGAVSVVTAKTAVFSLDKIAAFVIRCLTLSFAYFSLATGMTIYKLYYLHEVTSKIADLGSWVKELRSFARKYPSLVDEFPHMDRFLTPREQEWVQQRIASLKPQKKV